MKWGIAIALLPMALSAAEVEQRQHAFSEIETITDSAEDLIDDMAWEALSLESEKLVRYSQSLSGLFPEGSSEGSKAKSAVWDNPEKFNRLLSEMQQGYQQLNQAAGKQDSAAAMAGLEQATDTCRSCHRSYRSRW